MQNNKLSTSYIEISTNASNDPVDSLVEVTTVKIDSYSLHFPGTVVNDYNTGTTLENHTNCAKTTPSSREALVLLVPREIFLLLLLVLFSLATIGIFVEEVVFIIKTFKSGLRKKKTIWILSLHPVLSVCSLIAILIPKSTALVDMIANLFFGTCLYNFGRLMIHYMGGKKKMCEIVDMNRRFQTSTPPCCCCCLCLPAARFSRANVLKILVLVLQVAVLRPIAIFLAAILWTDGLYQVGNVNASNGFLYLTGINVASATSAAYGLMLLRAALRPELEKEFAISGKIATLQLTLIFAIVPLLIIAAMLYFGLIKCASVFPAKQRADLLSHCILILLMLPFSLMARRFYRRSCDGTKFAKAIIRDETKSTLCIATSVQEDSTINTTTPTNEAANSVV